jgi:hypothetical protein
MAVAVFTFILNSNTLAEDGDTAETAAAEDESPSHSVVYEKTDWRDRPEAPIEEENIAAEEEIEDEGYPPPVEYEDVQSDAADEAGDGS